MVDSVSSRYLDVLFQGKPGTLIINSEKVVFRPKLDGQPLPQGSKTNSRSWRWAVIDRVEVMDPARGSPYRNIKLKSSTSDNKAVTLTVPGGILDEVLKDINRRLCIQPDALGIEGAIARTTSLEHKDVPPPSMRRKSAMTNGSSSHTHGTSSNSNRAKKGTGSSSRRSSIATAPGVGGGDKPKRRDQLVAFKNNQSTRRSSMPSLTSNRSTDGSSSEDGLKWNGNDSRKIIMPMVEPNVIAAAAVAPMMQVQVEPNVAPREDPAQQEQQQKERQGLFKAAGQKLKPTFKNPLSKPPEKLRQQQESTKKQQRQEAEAKQPLLSSSEHTSGNSKAANNSKAQTRGFLNFMKAPPPRGRISVPGMDASVADSAVTEITELERKRDEQEARRRSLMERNSLRRTSMNAMNKSRRASMVSPRNGNNKAKLLIDDDGFDSPPPMFVPPSPSKSQQSGTSNRGGDRRQHHQSNRGDIMVCPPVNKHRGNKFNNGRIKEEEDITSRTSASSSPDSPKDTFPEEQPQSSGLWNPNAPEHKFRMMILHHAATCNMINGCPYDPICCEFKQVLQHIETCNNPECDFDKCRDTRNFLVTMRLMSSGDETKKSTNKDFLIGMGAMAPIPVIDIGDGQGSRIGEWDAFSMVSDSTWWEKAGA